MPALGTGRAYDTTERYASSPELSAVLTEVLAGDSITDVERTQYGYLLRSMLCDVQEAFVLNREGRLDDACVGTRAAMAERT